MNANQDNFHRAWPQVKAQVKQRWGKLAEADVQRLNGTLAELVAVLRARYGYGKAQAEIEINQWLAETDSGSSAQA